MKLARVVFAALWIVGQVTLVLTAGARADHIFGFRMFPEASTIEIHAWRETWPEVGGETAARTVALPHGEWSARDAPGQLRHFSWRDRVHDPVLSSLDTRVFASYGIDAQLARLQRALDDVADHIEEDDETRRLGADVTLSRNGGPLALVTLTSHVRPRR